MTIKRGEQNEKITSVLHSIGGFVESVWWYGWRKSQKYDLDFWNLRSAGFEELKNSKTANAYIRHIANEIDDFVRKFMKEYK